MRVLKALLISLVIHLLFLSGITWLAPKLILPDPNVIELELTPERIIYDAIKAKESPVVRQVELPEHIKLKDDETLARFLSEKTQRVKEESQANQTGKTQNRSNRETQLVPPPKATPPAKVEDKPQSAPDGDTKNVQKNEKDPGREVDLNKQLAEMNQFGDGFSSVGESLPRDVKVGSFTALNTDRYLFYTFYARVEDLIRYRWESRVQSQIDSLDRNTKLSLADRNWVTEAEFILDRKGNLRTAVIRKSSGIPAFDRAATEAFREARTFPNPPSEMITEDGSIRLIFSFTVRFNSSL